MQHAVPLILVADPDAANLAVSEAVLRGTGYATRACQTAWTAQRHIDMDQPDVLLLDLDLDWYDAGWDLLCWLRQEQATASIPVILCAADRSRLRAWQQHQPAPPCLILVKPFTPEQVLTAVQAALLVPPQSRAVGE